jgi:hypothetical protein
VVFLDLKTKANIRVVSISLEIRKILYLYTNITSMSRGIVIVVIVLFAGYFSACKKEVLNENILVAPDTTITTGDSLKAGIHYSNILPIFEVISPWHGGTSQEFDFDDDGVNDLYFSSSFSVSPGGINIRGCGIGSMRAEVEISTMNRVDSIVGWTVVTPGGTAYQSQNYVPGNSYPSNADTSVYAYTCMTKYPNGITLSKNGISFSVDTVMLASSNNSSFMGLPTSIQSGSWQTDDISYAAVKITKGSSTLLGWIEMSVSNYFEIRVYKKAYIEL